MYIRRRGLSVERPDVGGAAVTGIVAYRIIDALSGVDKSFRCDIAGQAIKAVRSIAGLTRRIACRGIRFYQDE